MAAAHDCVHYTGPDRTENFTKNMTDGVSSIYCLAKTLAESALYVVNYNECEELNFLIDYLIIVAIRFFLGILFD